MKKILKAILWCLAGLIAVCLIGLTALTVRDAFRLDALTKRISRVAVGDSRDQVRQVMGEPDASWGRHKAFLFNTEMLPGFAYGKSMDWSNAFHSEFPYFFPFRIRLFGPDHDDIVIEFDDNWIVTEIRIPE